MAFCMDFSTLPRCGAKTKQRNHQPCMQAACPNGRCYFHGGKRPIKHSMQTKMAHAQRKQSRQLIDQARNNLASMKALVSDSLKEDNNEQI